MPGRGVSDRNACGGGDLSAAARSRVRPAALRAGATLAVLSPALPIAACLSAPISSSRIFMSSCNSLPYWALLENQRESQVRLTPRRSPIGLIF